MRLLAALPQLLNEFQRGIDVWPSRSVKRVRPFVVAPVSDDLAGDGQERRQYCDLSLLCGDTLLSSCRVD